jgi:hypothetical protein
VVMIVFGGVVLVVGACVKNVPNLEIQNFAQ